MRRAVITFLIAAERAATEWSPIFSNVTEKSVHTLISFVFRPAKALCAFAGRLHYIAREPFFVSSRTRNAVKWRDLLASGKGRGMKAFPLGVSRALCASPRCGVRAQRTEVFAIVGKNRDRRRRRSLRRRDRYHEVTDEGSSRAAVPLPSPSSPPSAELLPGEKPLGDAERGEAGEL